MLLFFITRWNWLEWHSRCGFEACVRARAAHEVLGEFLLEILVSIGSLAREDLSFHGEIGRRFIIIWINDFLEVNRRFQKSWKRLRVIFSNNGRFRTGGDEKNIQIV